jgi:hypothetical protein
LGFSVHSAVVTSALFNGDPFTPSPEVGLLGVRELGGQLIQRGGVADEGGDTVAALEGLQDDMMPVRPVAPRMRMCISVCTAKRGLWLDLAGATEQ